MGCDIDLKPGRRNSTGMGMGTGAGINTGIGIGTNIHYPIGVVTGSETGTRTMLWQELELDEELARA